MKIQLNLKDEKELLSEIRTLLKGQIKSITRAEYGQMVIEVLNEKINSSFTNSTSVDVAIRDQFNQQIKSTIQQVLSKSYDRDFIKEEVRKQITEIVKSRFASGDI